MNPLQDLKKRLDGKNLSEVARRAGMAYRTVFILAKGRADDIYLSTYNRICKVTDEMEAEQCSSDHISKK